MSKISITSSPTWGRRRAGGKRKSQGRSWWCNAERIAAVGGRSSRKPHHTRLFVYGTFLAGERHHDELAGARFVGEARTKPQFNLLDMGGHPELAADGATAILGEVYEVSQPQLGALDRYFYRWMSRKPIELSDGSVADAYFARTDVRDRLLIASGSWRAHEEAFPVWTLLSGDLELVGTRTQIVRQLKEAVTGSEHLTLHQFIDWAIAGFREFHGIELSVRGGTEEERADSILKAMLRAGLLRRP